MLTQNTSRGVTPSETPSSFVKESVMARMVDDLVGGDRGFDGVGGEENLPPTPPEQTFDDTALFNDNSYGIPPLNTNEADHMTRSFSQMSYSGDGGARPSSSHPNNNPSTAVSPVIKQLPSLPSLPDQSSIWNRNYNSPGPSSPYAAHATTVRNSPLRPVANGHSREHSLNSIRSLGPSQEFWGAIGQSPAQNSRPQQTFVAGQGANYAENGKAHYGNLSTYANIYGQGGTTNPPTIDNGLISPLFFGSSPWNSDQERGQPTYGYPTNAGNGG